MKVSRLIISWTLHLILKESQQKEHEYQNVLCKSFG